jgi:hypothetical protein
MPVAQTTKGAPPVIASPPTNEGEHVRELAVEQIERKRRLHVRAFGAGAVAVVLVIIWAVAEYHNAGGWPTNGFSQSSGIHHEWNSWIIDPVIALALGCSRRLVAHVPAQADQRGADPARDGPLARHALGRRRALTAGRRT